MRGYEAEIELPSFIEKHNRKVQAQLDDKELAMKYKNEREKYKLQAKEASKKYKEVKKRVHRRQFKKVVKVAFATGLIVIGAYALLSNIKAEEIKANDNNTTVNYVTKDNNTVVDESSPLTQEDINNLINSNKEDNILGVSSSDYCNTVSGYLNNENGYYFQKYGSMYGVDPNILASIAMQESSLCHYDCLPGGSMYNGYGVGLMQLESPSGSSVTAYNYETGNYDDVLVTMDNACDIETNIKIGAMYFQNSLNHNNGNVLLAIQSHNFGTAVMDILLQEQASIEGKSVDEIKENYSDLTWMNYVNYMSKNPNLYLSDWEFDEYGDENYVKNVLRYCPVDSINCKYDGEDINFNLKNLSINNKVI